MKVNTAQSSSQGALGDEHRIQVTKTVVCSADGDSIFDDDCSSLPLQSGMVAKYTVTLEQVSSDTTKGIQFVYDELPDKFDFRAGTAFSPDSSFPEIEFSSYGDPEDIQGGVNDIRKWDFEASPITFVQGEVKTFTFEADIRNQADRYCNDVFLKMESDPNEKAGKSAHVLVGSTPPDGCKGGGAKVEKFVDTTVILPSTNTVLTYIINVYNLGNSTIQIDEVRDLLPEVTSPDVFGYCDDPTYPPDDNMLSCDDSMYKVVDDPFDPGTGDFTDTTGFTSMPSVSVSTSNDRDEIKWDNPGWSLAGAGGSGDTLIIRFMAHATLANSGSFYNEVFIKTTCSAPQALIDEGVTTNDAYCATFSWPTGGAVVPSYDVRSDVGRSYGQGAVGIDFSGPSGSLDSWHVE